jgi:hypothetical protein
VKVLTCAATRRRLQAYHDRELGVSDQISVASHLEWCDQCAAMLADLQTIRATLTALGPRRTALSHDEAAAFNRAVVNRLKAEHDVSFFVRARTIFDDMHVVYAALGAAIATVICVAVTLSMMRFATTNERPDSLAAIVSMMATPLECQVGNDLLEPSVCRERWVERFQRANEAAEQEAVFSLEAVLTKDSRFAWLSATHAGSRRAAAGQLKLIEGLLDSVSRSRLETGQSPQAPASPAMLWLVARETVRATKPPSLDVQLPAKKRAASLGAPTRTTRA